MQKAIAQNIIDISFLPNSAKVELIHYYEYLLLRYKVNKNSKVSKLDEIMITHDKEKHELSETMTKNEFLDFLKKGFTVSESELNSIEKTQKEINQWKIQAF
jgi:hypothetical protein